MSDTKMAAMFYCNKLAQGRSRVARARAVLFGLLVMNRTSLHAGNAAVHLVYMNEAGTKQYTGQARYWIALRTREPTNMVAGNQPPW